MLSLNEFHTINKISLKKKKKKIAKILNRKKAFYLYNKLQ